MQLYVHDQAECEDMKIQTHMMGGKNTPVCVGALGYEEEGPPTVEQKCPKMAALVVCRNLLIS